MSALGGLSLRDLEYVVAVAELKHFGRAAERCGVSQPSLSAQIRKLEELLGTLLFERSSRRVLVTPTGEVVIGQARTVLQEARRILEIARAAAGMIEGPFRLGVIPTLAPYLLPQVLRPIRERFPHAELTLTEARTPEIVARLCAGDLDAALLSPKPSGDRRLATIDLFFEPFLVIFPAGHPVARRIPVPMKALERPGLILLEEGHCLREQAIALCTRPVSRRHAASIETLKHMVAAGEGFSIVPALAAHAPGLEELVRFAPLREPSAGRPIGLVVRSTDPQALLYREVAKVIVDQAAPLLEAARASISSCGAILPKNPVERTAKG